MTSCKAEITNPCFSAPTAPVVDPFPRRITIELTSSCNLACTMCPKRYLSNSNGHMTIALFNRIMDQLQAQEIEAIIPFFRGEPLMHPRFLDMMAMLKENTSAMLQLATNAQLLTPSISEAIVALNIDFISFSLDAFRKETYDRIRVGGDYDLAVKNVKTFLALKKEHPACRTEVQVSATETPLNQDELPQFIDHWHPQVDRVRIYPCHSKDGKFGQLENDDLRRRNADRHACRKLFTDVVIYHDGRVALCNHDWNRTPDNALGSVWQTPIETIWQGEAYTSIRQKHLSHQWNTISPCGHCDHWINIDEETTPIGRLIT